MLYLVAAALAITAASRTDASLDARLELLAHQLDTSAETTVPFEATVAEMRRAAAASLQHQEEVKAMRIGLEHTSFVYKMQEPGKAAAVQYENDQKQSAANIETLKENCAKCEKAEGVLTGSLGVAIDKHEHYEDVESHFVKILEAKNHFDVKCKWIDGKCKKSLRQWVDAAKARLEEVTLGKDDSFEIKDPSHETKRLNEAFAGAKAAKGKLTLAEDASKEVCTEACSKADVKTASKAVNVADGNANTAQTARDAACAGIEGKAVPGATRAPAKDTGGDGGFTRLIREDQMPKHPVGGWECKLTDGGKVIKNEKGKSGNGWTIWTSKIRFDFANDKECGGDHAARQLAEGVWSFDTKVPSTLTLSAKGVAEADYEFLELEVDGKVVNTVKAIEGTRDPSSNQICKVSTCNMCLTKMPKKMIDIPPGSHKFKVTVDTQDGQFHHNSFFEISFEAKPKPQPKSSKRKWIKKVATKVKTLIG